MTPLRSTYAESAVCHERWQAVYRDAPASLRFDARVYEWLFRKLAPQGPWLDAGCGSGDRSCLIARHAPRVIGVDISPAILETARRRAAAAGLERQIVFECHALEELWSVAERCHVHCRGVLMHIPNWRKALANLCRCVRPGGYMVVIESNCWSLEALLVKLVRVFQRRTSRMARTDGGLEFWSEVDGKPFVVRMADLRALENEMRANGIKPLFRRSIAGIDLNRFPAFLRPAANVMNRLWFAWNLPFGSGVLIVGEKRA